MRTNDLYLSLELIRKTFEDLKSDLSRTCEQAILQDSLQRAHSALSQKAGVDLALRTLEMVASSKSNLDLQETIPSSEIIRAFGPRAPRKPGEKITALPRPTAVIRRRIRHNVAVGE